MLIILPASYIYFLIFLWKTKSSMATELQVIIRYKPHKDIGKSEGWYIFFPLCSSLKHAFMSIYIYASVLPVKRYIKWMYIFTVTAKLQYNFVFRGFRDRANVIVGTKFV